MLPTFIPSFLQSLVTKMMIFSIFAMSMNILWGYANIPTFGHAVFFGAGGYAAGILIFHAGISNFWLNLVLAVLFAAAVAALLGFPAFRVFGVGAGNTNPIYFLLVTLAFGEIASRVAIAARSLTGGSTGMAGIPDPELGMGLRMTPSRYYYLVFIFAVVCIYLMYRIQNSHYGYGLRASTTTSDACRLLATTRGSTSTRPGSSPARSAAWRVSCSPTSAASCTPNSLADADVRDRLHDRHPWRRRPLRGADRGASSSTLGSST